MSIKSKILAAAATLALLGAAGAALTAPAASAQVPSIAKVSNTTVGEAGYFVNDNGKTRFRDVQATFTVTAQMENLNGPQPAEAPEACWVIAPGHPGACGGVGVELCNDNTGYAAQLGLEFDAATGAFVAEYGWSGDAARGNPHLTANGSATDPDPCAEGGLLAQGNGEVFLNFLNSSPATANGAIHVGDVIHLEIYYAPRGHFFFHSLSFTITDVTQDITRVQTVYIPAQNFYEAGIGVVTDANLLTGGAVNLIGVFTGAFMNWYGNCYGGRCAPQGIVQPSHWDLVYANFVNGSNQVTLTPSALAAGNTAFEELEGSTSP